MIVRYLCAKHSLGKLYPEPLARALRCRALDGLAADHAQSGRARGAFIQLIRTPRRTQRDAGAIAQSVARDRAADGDAGRAPGAPRLSWPATRSPWPTSRSPARSHRWRGLPLPAPRRGRTSSAGTRPAAPHPAARGVLELPSPESQAMTANAPSSKSTSSPPTPYRGNPLAVVLDGERPRRRRRCSASRAGPTCRKPLSCCRRATHSADYRVRIFTPGGELPFAGHPTLGSCHAWLEAGGAPRAGDFIVQECGVGLVRLRREGKRLAFAAPPLQRSEPSPALLAEVAAALGTQGRPGARRPDASTTARSGWACCWTARQPCSRSSPDHGELKRLGTRWASRHARIRPVRAETPAARGARLRGAIGISEDPVTGSLNASLAQWLIDGRSSAARATWRRRAAAWTARAASTSSATSKARSGSAAIRSPALPARWCCDDHAFPKRRNRCGAPDRVFGDGADAAVRLAFAARAAGHASLGQAREPHPRRRLQGARRPDLFCGAREFRRWRSRRDFRDPRQSRPIGGFRSAQARHVGHDRGAPWQFDREELGDARSRRLAHRARRGLPGRPGTRDRIGAQPTPAHGAFVSPRPGQGRDDLLAGVLRKFCAGPGTRRRLRADRLGIGLLRCSGCPRPHGSKVRNWSASYRHTPQPIWTRSEMATWSGHR